MFWGNSIASDNSSGSSVFSSENSYEGVWHLGEESSGINNDNVYLDSTDNSYNLNDFISSNQRDGIIGYGKNFDGDDYIEGVSNLLDFERTDSFTIYAWIKNISTEFSSIISKFRALL